MIRGRPYVTSATGAAEPVKVWLCANDDLPPALAGVLAAHWLDGQEKETAGRFVFDRDRRQYVVAHTLMRRALAMEAGLVEPELVIWRSPRGRPFLQFPEGGLPRGGHQLDFNLSHAGGYNLLGVVRRHRIGVDIERADREPRSLETIARTFTPQEQTWVAAAGWGGHRERRVLRLWTLKEAYSKARGLGLGLSFDSFSFTLDEDRGVTAFSPPADDPAGRWSFLELEPVPDVLVAIAVRADEGGPATLELHHGFPWTRSAPLAMALPEPVGEETDRQDRVLVR
ncbi:4'-phosphopantetheinyl transferase superfamily protein [Streptomyces sp. NPDC048275]|uniref:4'-phosphopantetheinyl transferase family protein n=1 Tax=Streptomyces sp. NPDC048275 TaxID=3155629 RepID=UPI0033E09EBE